MVADLLTREPAGEVVAFPEGRAEANEKAPHRCRAFVYFD